MFSMYCSIQSSNCTRISCSNASEFLSDVDCLCITPEILQHINDKIAANSQELKSIWEDQTRQNNEIYSNISSKLIGLQDQIGKNTLEISKLHFEDDKIWLELSGLDNDLLALDTYSKGFLGNWVQSNSDWIAQLNKDVYGNTSNLGDLNFRVDNLESDSVSLYNKVAKNKLDIAKIRSALFASGISINGVNDDYIPEFGGGGSGGSGSGDGCENCVKKNENNNIAGDMIMSGNVELINRDLELRYPFPKGNIPTTKKQLSILIRDNAGNVTSDNVHAFSGSVDNDGTVQTYMRGYRFTAGSIEHCDFVLRVPKVGQCYAWTQNLRLGCMQTEGADSDASSGCGCGAGWLEVCGDTTMWEDLEVKKNVELNTDSTGDKDHTYHTTIKGETTVQNDLHVTQNVTINENGGTTVINGPTTIKNTLEVHKDSHFHQKVTIDGSTTIKNTLEVYQNSHFHTNVQVDGSTTINQNLEVHQDSHFHGTVEVDEEANFHNNINVDQNINVKGDVIAYGVVEGNHNAEITGAGASLLTAKGYFCDGAGPMSLFTVHNGTDLGTSSDHLKRFCETAVLTGCLTINNGGIKLSGDARLDGRVVINGNGGGGGSFGGLGQVVVHGSLELTTGSSDLLCQGKIVCRGSKVSLEGEGIDLWVNGTQTIEKRFTANAGMDVKGHSSFNGNIQGVQTLWANTINATNIGTTALSCSTINGSPYKPCNCVAAASLNPVLLSLREVDEEKHFEISQISSIDESNTITGISNPDINDTDIYESVVELPVHFASGGFTVQVSYMTDVDFNKSLMKELVPLVVKINPDDTNKFTVYGNIFPYTWTVTGNA